MADTPSFASPAPDVTDAQALAAANAVSTGTTTAAMTETTEHKIHWGGVIKGIAIVTAVVVAGYVGLLAAEGAATWLMGVPAIHSAVMGVAGFIAPVTTYISDTLLPMIPTMLSNVFTPIGHTLSSTLGLSSWNIGLPSIGGLFGGTVSAAADAEITAHTIAAAGALGLGGATAVALQQTHGALANLPLTETVHHIVPTGFEDGGASHALAANDHALNGGEHADMEASLANSTMHHAVHPITDHAGDHAAEAAENHERRVAHAMQAGSDYSRTLQATGSHAQAVAARRENIANVDHHSSFTEALNDESARLRSTLGLAK